MYYKTLEKQQQLMIQIQVCLFPSLFLCGTLETEDKGTKISMEKFSRKSKNCRLSNLQTIQLKILEVLGTKSNGTETPGKKCLEILVHTEPLKFCPRNYRQAYSIRHYPGFQRIFFSYRY